MWCVCLVPYLLIKCYSDHVEAHADCVWAISSGVQSAVSCQIINQIIFCLFGWFFIILSTSDIIHSNPTNHDVIGLIFDIFMALYKSEQRRETCDRCHRHHLICGRSSLLSSSCSSHFHSRRPADAGRHVNLKIFTVKSVLVSGLHSCQLPHILTGKETSGRPLLGQARLSQLEFPAMLYNITLFYMIIII